MLKLVNDLRTRTGRGIVFLNDKLNTAARNHSIDMANNNYFEHEGLNGSSFSERIRATGYSGGPRGENIAAGSSSIEDTFNQWLNSGGHLQNMLNANVNEMGIGYGFNSSADYRHYWTQVFAQNNTLSVDEIQDDNPLSFVTYPNPIHDVLYIKSSKSIANLNYKLYNVTGQLINHGILNNTNGRFKIPTENLSKGLYILELNKSTIKKLIKN